MVIDSHCHLDSFADDLEAVVARAKTAGVEKILTIGTTPTDFTGLAAIATQYPGFVEVTAGIHPDYSAAADEQTTEDYFQAIDLPSQKYVVGIGEIGLDYRDAPPRAVRIRQQELFSQQLFWAGQLQLPVCIHMRDATDDVLHILRQFPGQTGVFHCFGADCGVAKQALDLGFFVSFSGIVTFKNAKTVQEAAKYVPLDHLLIETDAPYLAPTPHRGARNEPAYVRLVGEFIAVLRGVEYDTVAHQTSANFYQLYPRAVRIKPE
ncbi:MAG: TatD family hydrolase [Holosporales bacterium]|jgi:TatD DNase family protein|nr:TatD family hydrolase [Holosporales bacterium]